MDKTEGLYLNFHKVDVSHLRKLVADNRIDIKIAEALLSYWKKRLDDTRDAVYTDYIEYYLFFESLKGLFIAAYIFDTNLGSVTHSYGVLPALSPAVYKTVSTSLRGEQGAVDFSHNGHTYVLHYIRSGYHEQEFIFACLSLKDLDITENLKRLEYVFERYYLPSSFSKDSRVALLFSETQNALADIINPVIARGEPVTFTYLYFESMTKYVGLAGENFARGLLEELQQDVHRILKDTDRSFVLSPREILIVSVNCESDIMQKRFQSTYFHAKSLLLSFQVRYHTVRTPVLDMYALWDDITGNIAYSRKLQSAQ
jgi:hypothetical protein